MKIFWVKASNGINDINRTSWRVETMLIVEFENKNIPQIEMLSLMTFLQTRLKNNIQKVIFQNGNSEMMISIRIATLIALQELILRENSFYNHRIALKPLRPEGRRFF